MAARLGFVDLLQGPEYYSTRTITDSTASGAAVGTLPASNLFNRNLSKPWKRTGLASGDTCQLDIDFVRVRPDRQAESGEAQCAGIGLVVVAGISATTSAGGVPYAVNVSFHATTNAFASSGGTNPHTSETFILGSQTSGAIRTAFLSSDSATYVSNVGGANYSYTTGMIGRYIRVMVQPQFAGGGTCDITVGRILLMQTLRFSPAFDGFTETTENYSEVVNAFDGTPYILPRTSARKANFTLLNIPVALVNRYFSQRFNANVLSANRLMASGADAALVMSDANGDYVNMPGILGRLTSPLAVQALKPEGALSYLAYNVSGEITETPF